MTKHEVKLDNKIVIPMDEMEPFQVGIIVDSDIAQQIGTYVMRTQSTCHFEVMNLSIP